MVDLKRSEAAPAETQTLPRSAKRSSSHRHRRNSRSSRNGSPDRLASMNDVSANHKTAASNHRPGLLVLNSSHSSQLASSAESPIKSRRSPVVNRQTEEHHGLNPTRPATTCRTNTQKLIRGIEQADGQLQVLFDSGNILEVRNSVISFHHHH